MNAPRTVLIISLAYFPDFVGGAEVAIEETAKRISPEDIVFHMVTLRLSAALPREETIGNVRVHRIGFGNTGALNKFLFQFLAAWKAYTLHRTHHYDALWAVMAHSAGVPAALFKFCAPRVPLILTLQEGDPPSRIERTMLLVWPLFSRAFKKADIVQSISTFLGKWARVRGFTGPLEVIPNGVHTRHFSQEYPPRAIDEVKDQLGKAMGEVFLVTVSRLVHKNALDDVITALAMLPEHVKFIIIGTGPLEKKLKLEARSLKLEARVLFVGHIGHEELPKYLKACDIFVRPSRSEGMGNAFIEAFAAGLPVVATQEGGIADFLFDPDRNNTHKRAISNGAGEKLLPEDERWNRPVPSFQTGWAVDRDAPKQIAEAVKDIMAHPEKMRAVVATARAMVEEKYDWDIIAKDMREKVFESAFLMRG